jgi:hyperosmotically inducible periplasmic protein
MRTAMVTFAAVLAAGALTPIRAADQPTNRGATDRRDADDTGRNVRDRDDRALTPMDQGGSEADRTITQQIRKDIVADDQLSSNAKNVKIITIDGVVTLRGPVKNSGERTTIAGIARKTSGVKRVDDQIEVESNP